MAEERRQRLRLVLPDSYRGKGCSCDELVLAMICLLERHPSQPDSHDGLARLGVCKPRIDDGASR